MSLGVALNRERYRADGERGVRHSSRNPQATSWSTADATADRENQASSTRS
jgi:hypothetical protein